MCVRAENAPLQSKPNMKNPRFAAAFVVLACGFAQAENPPVRLCAAASYLRLSSQTSESSGWFAVGRINRRERKGGHSGLPTHSRIHELSRRVPFFVPSSPVFNIFSRLFCPELQNFAHVPVRGKA